MTKTQAQVVADLRLRLDESTARQWLDTELRGYLNDGMRDIARRAEVLSERASQNIVAGTQEYTAPVDTVKISRVEYIDSSGHSYNLTYRDFNTMDSVWWSSQTTAQGRPSLFTLWGYPPTLKIILYPKPSESVANGLKVYYYRVPAPLATDGSAAATAMSVPEGWEDLIVDYAEYMALRKDRDPAWQEAKSLYEEAVGAMFDSTRRYSDQAGMFDTDNGGPIPRWIYDESYVD